MFDEALIEKIKLLSQFQREHHPLWLGPGPAEQHRQEVITGEEHGSGAGEGPVPGQVQYITVQYSTIQYQDRRSLQPIVTKLEEFAYGSAGAKSARTPVTSPSRWLVSSNLLGNFSPGKFPPIFSKKSNSIPWKRFISKTDSLEDMESAVIADVSKTVER